MISEIDLAELDAARAAGATVVDVREPSEYAEAHVPCVVPIPLATLPTRLAEIPESEPVYVICQHGGRSLQAAQLLDRAGYDARSVAGGTSAWVESGRPVETG